LAFVLVAVVEVAAQLEVVELGGAAVGPVLAVVDLAPGRWPVTAGSDTVPIAGDDCSA
jgi:hypothetical protein